ETGKRLQQIVERRARQEQTEIYTTFKGLERRLQHPIGIGDIALLLAATPNDLSKLVANRHLFDGLRLILILPNEKMETFARGHLLRPRYISTRDNDFSENSI
ncbi:MAG: hypothetical protein C0407_15530, partial [Desulfobacca sp.]|nr:hypothetical protein [Desulfobacca sp.]